MHVVTPEQTSVGWIGTGVMGRSMCGHVLRAGYRVTVFNRTRSAAEPLLDQGARWAETPSEAARNSDVLFTIVGFPEDVRDIYLGGGDVLRNSRPGGVIVDMTTSEPSLAEEIARAAGQRGGYSLDAPVSGGDVGARNATLSIMAGGERPVFEAVLPLLRSLGKNIRYMGGAGKGQHAKAANQVLVAGTMIGTVESLLYGIKAGLSPDELIEVLQGGAAACWSMGAYGPRIVGGNLDPGFMVEHFLKDMNIVLKEAERMNLPLPGLALCKQLYVAARALGFGRLGTHSLFKVLAAMAGVDQASFR